jgi:predicted nucleic acid-binding protein
MGLTVLDAGVLIGFLDANDAHHERATAAMRSAVDRGDRIVLPASAYAEVLVGPSRSGARAVAMVDSVLERVPVEIGPLTQVVAARAAALRARHAGLQLPDALVIATASHLDADLLVTTDRRWPARGALRLRAAIAKL